MHKFFFYNKLIIKRICALSWLITKIILRCMVSKIYKKKILALWPHSGDILSSKMLIFSLTLMWLKSG